MPTTQQNRFIAIKTPLGPDKLLLKSFSMTQELGRMFQIEAELASEDAEIDFDKVVGHNVTIRLDLAQKEKRYFNGFVSRLVQVANQGGFARYHATIVPWLWFLTRTSDCRIFQKKTIEQILKEVFTGHGFSDFETRLGPVEYEPSEYCVQYRETDFNFVSRLMEEEGIYYFFKHEEGKHTLVLADSISDHSPYAGYEEIVFHGQEEGAAGHETIFDWAVEQEVQPVAVALNDFDFRKPKASLKSSSNVPRQHGKAQFEIYDYPGVYDANKEGDRLTSVRLEELQTQHKIARGQASARGLAPGFTFKLKNHPRKDQNGEYLITGVTLNADAGPFATSGGGSEGEFFSCNFATIDKKQQFRAARLTPEPIIQGVQTAIVVGPAGGEIYVDKYGRVKVQFHWDREGKHDENSSCWIRVSQSWTGKGWGHIANPHIHQEVIVAFEEGDPDRPIIVGRVYNEDNMPPYPLPGGAAITGSKTSSTKTTSVYSVASKIQRK